MMNTRYKTAVSGAVGACFVCLPAAEQNVGFDTTTSGAKLIVVGEDDAFTTPALNST
ncbi:MAG: hypothetical protein AAGB22_02750 [Bacteroidota bacterium]